MNVRRWGIALAGVILQVVLGSAYAWSVFRVPLSKQFHWSISQVTMTFTVCIFVLGVAAFFGGLWMKKVGPRPVAVIGALLYGVGTLLASFTSNLGWLYASYGVIGGIGLGFAYIVPIAVLVKWFPDKRGLMTGIGVGGFGVGALVVAPTATALIKSSGVLTTFLYLGIAYTIVGVIAAWFMQMPEAGWLPKGWTPKQSATTSNGGKDYTLGQALGTWQFYALWLILFLNTSAGISLIAQEAPVFQELAKVTAAVAAGMVGIVAIGNALGRVFWASVSDLITRRGTFAVMFLLQVGLFWFLPSIASSTTLTAVAFIILMCYGGGFGTMPAFAADFFGSTNYGSIYGLMLTAWGCASAFGPLLVANMRQSSGSYTSGFHVLAAIVLVSTLLPIIVRKPAKLA